MPDSAGRDSEKIMFRLPPDLKAAFEAVCERQDQNVSQTLRNLIRKHVRENQQLELEMEPKPRKTAAAKTKK